MSGIKELSEIMRNLNPILSEGDYMFCSFQNVTAGDLKDLEPFGMIRETEGVTLVLDTQTALPRNIKNIQGLFRCITLNVHSSLESVGLTAKVSTKLAEHGISANIMAGYYHDHIFVPFGRANDAMAAIKELSENRE